MTRPLDVRKIHSFCEIVRHGSYRLAALSMGISQPALTRQIARLEEELGVVLLERGSRNIGLTEAGKILFDRSAALLDDLNHTRNLVKSFGARPEGTVTLAVLTTFSASFSTCLLRRAAHHLPLVRLCITEGTSHYVEQRLLTGEADIGILLDGPISSKLVGERLIEEDFHLFGRTFPDPRDIWSFADIATLPMVLPPPPHGTRRLIDAAARNEGIRLRPHCEVDSPYLIRELMLNEGLFGILPNTAVARERSHGMLESACIANPPVRAVIVGTVKGAPLSTAARALAQEIRRVVEESDEDIVVVGEGL